MRAVVVASSRSLIVITTNAAEATEVPSIDCDLPTERREEARRGLLRESWIVKVG